MWVWVGTGIRTGVIVSLDSPIFALLISFLGCYIIIDAIILNSGGTMISAQRRKSDMATATANHVQGLEGNTGLYWRISSAYHEAPSAKSYSVGDALSLLLGITYAVSPTRPLAQRASYLNEHIILYGAKRRSPKKTNKDSLILQLKRPDKVTRQSVRANRQAVALSA